MVSNFVLFTICSQKTGDFPLIPSPSAFTADWQRNSLVCCEDHTAVVGVVSSAPLFYDILNRYVYKYLEYRIQSKIISSSPCNHGNGAPLACSSSRPNLEHPLLLSDQNPKTSKLHLTDTPALTPTLASERELAFGIPKYASRLQENLPYDSKYHEASASCHISGRKFRWRVSIRSFSAIRASRQSVICTMAS